MLLLINKTLKTLTTFMTYNDFILNNFKDFLLSYYDKINSRGEFNFAVTNITIAEPPSDDISYYIKNNSTCEYQVSVHYDFNGESKTPVIIKVPKQINNLFIIKGKFRMCVYVLENDSNCRFYYDTIQFDYNRKYDVNSNQLNYKNVDEDSWEFINLQEYDSTGRTDLDKYLELSQAQITKLKVKLDTDNVSSRITYELVKKCIEYGDDKSKDFILDKRIVTAEESLLRFLSDYNKRGEFISSSRSSLRADNKQKLYPTTIQKFITGFFNLQKNKHLNVQIPVGVNPLSFESIRHKISVEGTISYNETFSDIIDPIDTPENNNVNRINELNKCARISYNKIYISVYDTEFNPVEVEYLDYLNSRVLSYKNVDYNDKKIGEGPYEYQFRNKKYKSDKLPDIQYIDAKPDDKLSILSRRIPFINHSDSIRNSMATTFLRQCIELKSSEGPLVSTGYDASDYNTTSLVKRYSGSNKATVTSIQGDFVNLTDDNGREFKYEIPDPLVGNNKINITFVSKVSVGDSLNSGDPVVVPNVMKKSTFDMGINALVALHPYHGLNFEDGVCVSKSFARRMGHYSTVDLVFHLKDSDLLDSIKDCGETVKSRDKIIQCLTDLNYTKSTRNLREALRAKELSNYRSKDLRVPNNIDEAVISDIYIRRGKMDVTTVTEKMIKNYKKDRSAVRDKIPERYFHRTISNIEPELPEDQYSYFIVVRLVQLNELKPGDKISNRFGSKGTISSNGVIDDDKMIKTEDGRVIDITLHPQSIIARKNVAQRLEMYCGLIIQKLYSQIIEKLNSPEFNYSEIQSMLKKYYGNRFDSINEPTFRHQISILRASYLAFNVGCYATLKPDTILGWCQELGIETKTYCIDGFSGRKIKLPVEVGPMYILKLMHLPEITNKVTPSGRITNSPILGKGSFRLEGQKLGEAENWVLNAYGQYDLMKRLRNVDSTNDLTLINQLLMAGITIKSQEGANIDTDISDKIKELREKFGH